MTTVFLSYAREDRPAAAKLAQALESRGFEVWWDWELIGGDDFRKVIAARLAQADRAIVLWSESSVGSHFVADEAESARAAGKLVPVSLHGATPPLGFRSLQTLPWDGATEGIGAIEAALKGNAVPQEELMDELRRRRFRRYAWIGAGVAASIAAAILVTRQLPAPQGKLCTRYNMESSVMRTVQAGSTLSMVYDQVRASADPNGFKPGDWLFRGDVTNERLVKGMARSHRPSCGFIEYEMTGTISGDGREINLQGSRPTRRADCKVFGHEPDKIHFTCADG